MLGRIDEAKEVPLQLISKIRNYREAVRACWLHKRRQRMTQETACEEAGMIPQHFGEYIAPEPFNEKGKKRRDMPTKYIKSFQAAMGNTIISQWLAYDAGLTVLESIVADQKRILDNRSAA